MRETRQRRETGAGSERVKKLVSVVLIGALLFAYRPNCSFCKSIVVLKRFAVNLGDNSMIAASKVHKYQSLVLHSRLPHVYSSLILCEMVVVCFTFGVDILSDASL